MKMWCYIAFFFHRYLGKHNRGQIQDSEKHFYYFIWIKLHRWVPKLTIYFCVLLLIDIFKNHVNIALGWFEDRYRFSLRFKIQYLYLQDVRGIGKKQKHVRLQKIFYYRVNQFFFFYTPFFFFHWSILL